MTIEQFLLFWNLHNIAIIEGLVAVILVSSLFIAFRSFFSRPEDAAGSSLDTAQIEKTLQKILEAQALAKTAAGKASAAVSEDLGLGVDISNMDMSLGGGDSERPSAEALKELEQVRTKLVESQKQIETLQAQVAAAPSASVAGLGAGNEEKIRELEARLAEYEIISEDIADLSRFKEENEKLKLELDQLRSKSGPAPATAAAPAPPPPVAAAPEPPPVAVAPTPAAAPAPPPVAAAPAPIIEENPAEAALVDDELMKEFAAAVAGQQALNGVAEKAGAGNAATEKPTDETEKLMSEFETFVAKKS